MDGPHMVAMGVESMICYWRELLELLPPGSGSLWTEAGWTSRCGRSACIWGSPPLLAAGGEEYFPSAARVGTEDLSYAVTRPPAFPPTPHGA